MDVLAKSKLITSCRPRTEEVSSDQWHACDARRSFLYPLQTQTSVMSTAISHVHFHFLTYKPKILTAKMTLKTDMSASLSAFISTSVAMSAARELTFAARSRPLFRPSCSTSCSQSWLVRRIPVTFIRLLDVVYVHRFALRGQVHERDIAFSYVSIILLP